MNVNGVTAGAGSIYTAGQTQSTGSRKFMERAERGEKVNLFEELGRGVSVDISKEGMEELDKRISEIKNGNPDLRELSKEEKEELLQEAIKPLKNLHPIIPNIQTNDKLVKSLDGADARVVDAAYTIIQNNLLPHDVGDLTEDERQELILVGLEEARYLAKELDEEKSGLFMEAMETIAKYGINGKLDGQGKVAYDIRWGALVGAPDDYISTGDLMKKISPKEYEEFSAMMREAAEKNDDKLLMKAMRFMIDWEPRAYRENPKAFEDMRAEQVSWKKGVEDTRIEEVFADTDRTSMQSLMDSILSQSRVLDQGYLIENLRRFAEIAGYDL